MCRLSPSVLTPCYDVMSECHVISRLRSCKSRIRFCKMESGLLGYAKQGSTKEIWYHCKYFVIIEAKEKYRGMFETQKSGNKTRSGEIGLDIRTHASPKVGQDQVSGGISVLCWHAASVAYVLWKPRINR